MKVLFLNRNASLWVGGDSIQLENTRRSLEKLGVNTCFSYDPNGVSFEGIDLVHIFHVNFEWSISMATRCIRDNMPYVISAIFYPERNFDVRNIIQNSVKTIALSDNEKNEILTGTKCEESKLTVISNGVDKNLFKFDGTFDLCKRINVVNIGRVIPSKGVDLLANACASLRIPYIHIDSNDDASYLASIKSKLSQYYSSISQEKIVEVFQSCRLYVCPSLTERQSLGVLEAAACGLPIIDSVYNRGNKLLPSSIVVDPKNSETLVSTLSAIYHNVNLKSNTDFVPSWDDIGEQILKIYREVK